MFLTLSIKDCLILEKYIQILCYPYLQIIFKKNFYFTVRISENIELKTNVLHISEWFLSILGNFLCHPIALIQYFKFSLTSIFISHSISSGYYYLFERLINLSDRQWRALEFSVFSRDNNKDWWQCWHFTCKTRKRFDDFPSIEAFK